MSPQLERSYPASDTELFRALFDHALDAVLISDDRGVYVQVNRAACELIGLPCEEILGRPVAEFFDMGQAQSVDAAWGSFLEQGAMQGECWVRRADGQQRCCSFRAKANFVPGLHMSFLRDITGEKEAIQALENSNRKLSLLSNVSRELLANSRPRTLLNKLFAEICAELGVDVYLNFLVSEGTRLRLDSCGGIAPEIVAQLEWLDFGQAVCGTVAAERTTRLVEDVQNSADPMTELIRSLGIQAYICHPLLHGEELLGTLSFGSRTRPDFHTDELQLMRIVADGISIALHRAHLISDLERNNNVLKRTNEVLGQSNAELYHFAYAVGHDLKAPLRTVASFAQLLTRRLDTHDGEMQDFVSIINNAVLGMNKFLDDLLRYAQVGSVTKRQYPLVDANLVLEWALMNLRGCLEITFPYKIVLEYPGRDGQSHRR